jgi:hypothetical protein
VTHGTFRWNALMTTDVERAKAFYGATVGWTFKTMAMPEGDYTLAHIGGAPVAGLMEMGAMVPPGTPPHWFAYLEVDDVDQRVAEVAAHGGRVLPPPFDIEGVGRIAILADPTGAVMGWMTPKR